MSAFCPRSAVPVRPNLTYNVRPGGLDVTDANECPNVSACEMYRLFKLAGSLAVWKINYCGADFTRCARYQRSSTGQSVPLNLMPNGGFLKRKPEGGG